MARKSKEKETNVAEIVNSLEAEFDEVAGRIERVEAELDTGDKFVKKFGEEQFNLLIDHHNSMIDYRNILAIRISLLKRKINGGK